MRANQSEPLVAVTAWRESGPFRLETLRYRADTHVPSYTHETLNVCLVLAGECTEWRSGSTHRYQGPALTINTPSTSQEFVIGGADVVCLCVDVEESWLDEVNARAAAGSSGPALLGSIANLRDPTRVAAALRLREVLAERDDLATLSVEERLLELLTGLDPEGGTDRRPPAWLKRVRERLDDDPDASPDLVTLAREAGVHRVHLARSFRLYYSRSVGEYLRGIRLRRAQVDLANSDATLVRVALRAGFYDQSHFNRHFRNATGMTPGEFRRLASPA